MLQKFMKSESHPEFVYFSSQFHSFISGVMVTVRKLYLVVLLVAISSCVFIILMSDVSSYRKYRYNEKNMFLTFLLDLEGVNQNHILHLELHKSFLLQHCQQINRFVEDNQQIFLINSKNKFENLTWKLDTTEVDICDNESSFILAIVPSSVRNFRQRQLIRKSWAKREYLVHTRIKATFWIGSTTNNKLQNQIQEEALKFKDIIQINYLDAYRNLTYKTLTALMWVSEKCKGIPWILKIDDDVILNPYNLRIFLEKEFVKNPSPSIIMGRLRPHSRPFRKGKWNVSQADYPNKYYPPFILGSAYIIGRNAVEKLIAFAKNSTFLYLEDVFFTGIVAQKAKVPLKNIEKQYFSTETIYRKKPIFLVGAPPKIWKPMWENIYAYKPKLI